jgi:RNA polymerase sigma-70 factor (ECF subfamily)
MISQGGNRLMFSWRHRPESGPSGQAEPLPFGRQLDRARSGEPEALGVLYRRFLPSVFGYIAARVPDRAAAEDLTSEVFLQMIEGISRLRASEEAGFTAWILQIARVAVAGYYRKREGQPVVVPLASPAWDEADEGDTHLTLFTQDPAADPVHQAEAREEWSEVVKAMNALTEDQRQVLIHRLILGYDIATVARMLGKKANAVKVLQFRALHSLRRLLQRNATTRQALSARIQRPGGAS